MTKDDIAISDCLDSQKIIEVSMDKNGVLIIYLLKDDMPIKILGNTFIKIECPQVQVQAANVEFLGSCAFASIEGDANVEVGGNVNLQATGTINLESDANVNITSGGTVNIN